MNAEDQARLDELVSRYLDDALGAGDHAALLAMLAEPAGAARFLEATRLNSEIAGLLAAPVPDAAMVALVRADIRAWQGAPPAAPGGAGEPSVAIPGPTPAVALRPASLPARGRRALAWAAGFVLCAGLAAAWFGRGGRAGDVPSVTSLEGQARLVSPRGPQALAPGAAWPRGQTLQIQEAGSTATVIFRDGTRLALAAGSEVVNESGGTGLRVELKQGELRAEVRKQPAGRPFVIVTPQAEAVVVGTALRIAADELHTRLYVTEGRVLLKRRSDGAELMVPAGFRAFVGNMGRLKAEPMDPSHPPH